MASSSSFEQGLIDLLGEDTYRVYFTDHETDHTPCNDQASEQEFNFDKGGAELFDVYNLDMDRILIEASEIFEKDFLASENQQKKNP